MKKVMKRSFILLAVCLVAVTGCDFLRKAAGRPTSADLEAKRERIQQVEQLKAQQRQDSIRREQEREAERLATLEAHLLDSLSHAQGPVISPSRLGGLESELTNRYYIIVGAFRSLPNAQKKMASCAAAGYVSTIITFRTGLNAVAVCPSDNLPYTVKMIDELRRGGICPDEGWILANR